MAPLVVALQSHLLDAMPTVVIAPMLRVDAYPAYSRTSARVEFQGEAYVVSTAELAAADARGLTRSLGSLRDLEDDIRHALTFVFSGV